MRRLALVAALLTASGIMGSADAQQTQPGYGSMMGGMHMGPGMMGSMPMMGGSDQGAPMCAMMTGHIEGRLAYMKAELKITPAQEALFAAYANAMRDNLQAMAAHCATMMSQGGPASLSLPDRLDLHEQFMAVHLDAVRAMSKALKPLYASFDDAQKRAADQLFSGMGMM